MSKATFSSLHGPTWNGEVPGKERFILQKGNTYTLFVEGQLVASFKPVAMTRVSLQEWGIKVEEL